MNAGRHFSNGKCRPASLPPGLLVSILSNVQRTHALLLSDISKCESGMPGCDSRLVNGSNRLCSGTSYAELLEGEYRSERCSWRACRRMWSIRNSSGDWPVARLKKWLKAN